MKYLKKEKDYFLSLMFLLIVLNLIFVMIWRFKIWINCTTSSLPLSQLIISGKRLYTIDDDIRKLVLNNGCIGTFITQDIHVIQNKIKSFSWIKQVSVRRQWPDKLKIYIIEHIPVASWNDSYMLTQDALLFTVPENNRVDKEFFPILSGPRGTERYVLSTYYVLNKILQSSSFRIKSVSMSDRYSWEIVLQDGAKLILGRKNHIVRLQRFIKVYPVFLKKYLKNNEFVNYIDLRYKSGFSVKKISILKNLSN